MSLANFLPVQFSYLHPFSTKNKHITNKMKINYIILFTIFLCREKLYKKLLLFICLIGFGFYTHCMYLSSFIFLFIWSSKSKSKVQIHNMQNVVFFLPLTFVPQFSVFLDFCSLPFRNHTPLPPSSLSFSTIPWKPGVPINKENFVRGLQFSLRA